MERTSEILSPIFMIYMRVQEIETALDNAFPWQQQSLTFLYNLMLMLHAISFFQNSMHTHTLS